MSTPNPFDNPGYTANLPDPFVGAQEPQVHQTGYPPIERFGSPPFVQRQPSPHDAYGNQYNPGATLSPPRPSRTPHAESYELQDHGVVDNDDIGDMPLLRRDTRSSAGGHFPGGYERTATEEEDEPATNIRYGGIPQRVPRRYKTLKKVE